MHSKQRILPNQTVVADDDKDDLNEDNDDCHAACTEEGGIKEIGLQDTKTLLWLHVRLS